jgi:hypothetical protein
MAKRRSSGADMNLDSLLDTLTNVVGVLVLVLLLVSLNVREAVERILEFNPDQLGISASDLAGVQKQAADLARQREELAQLASPEQVTADEQEVIALRQQIDKLNSGQAPEPIPPEKLEELRKKVADDAKKSQELAKQVANMDADLQKLKGQLDQTQPVAAPPAKIVSLPNPREAPKDAKPLLVICRDERVAAFDPDALRESAKKRAQFLLTPLQKKAGPDGAIDCQKFVDQFNKASSVSSEGYRARLAVENFNLVLIYEPRGTAGETAKQVVNAGSELRRVLKRLDPQKFYIRFLVWSDSFDAYVAARAVCDELNVLAGWEPYNADFQWKIGLGIAVNCEGKPKPPPAPPPAKTDPGQPVPPPPPPPPPLPNDVVD